MNLNKNCSKGGVENIYKLLLRKLKSNPLKLEDIEVFIDEEGKKKKDE